MTQLPIKSNGGKMLCLIMTLSWLSIGARETEVSGSIMLQADALSATPGPDYKLLIQMYSLEHLDLIPTRGHFVGQPIRQLSSLAFV